MAENIVCSIIDVDCYPNDDVDIRFGGPKFIGFEFYVRKKDKDVMKDYVTCMLHEYNIPIIGIRNTKSKIVNETQLHSVSTIRDVIEKYKDYASMCEGYRKIYCRKISR